MKKHFVKRFSPETPYQDIRREARFQRRAAALGFAPSVLRCTRTTIVMDHLRAPCLAEVYGESPDDLPQWIKDDILDILYSLYAEGIEYVDVTAYNFVEKDGLIWIVDFGHARDVGEEIDSYLDDLFARWDLQKWNPDFA